MATDKLLLRDVIGGFAPGQELRAILLLTYTFDGKWLEEVLIPELFNRPVDTALVIRDRNALITEAPTVRYRRINAAFSQRVFHPKLALLVADDRALAVIGSANLTRGGLERNLELASTFEVSRDGGPRTLFGAISDYVKGPLLQEVDGPSHSALQDIAVALNEVLRRVPKEEYPQHMLLHNYNRTIWEQILEQLPSRERCATKVSIISPFFEPNSIHVEDPSLQPDDDGIFKQLFKDLKFEQSTGDPPVTVFFQQSEEGTQLPIDKLKTWQSKISLRLRSTTTPNEPRPLHGKMLLIEGAKNAESDAFLIAVHGSPNFTSAALLAKPPYGNSELAVLTRLPVGRNGSARVWSALGLTDLFVEVKDWSKIRHVVAKPLALPSIDAFRITDATLRVSDRKLVLTWQGTVPVGSNARVLIEINGAWTPLGSVVMGAELQAEIIVPDLTQTDVGGLISIRASRILVELIDPTGAIVAKAESPINVDCPQQFCGLAMVGPLLATLDQRIAFAGCGTSQTYREQQQFLELHYSRVKGQERQLSVITHQADMDRFFRNLHTGCRGLRSRVEAMPNSEFTLRRAIRDLGRWCQETIGSESGIASSECRLFLIDRLCKELDGIVARAQRSSSLAPKLGPIMRTFEINPVMLQVARWVESLPVDGLGGYSIETARRAHSIIALIRRIEES